MAHKSRKNFSGFSYIEAIISIFILSAGIVVVASLISVGLRDSLDVKNQQIAAFLAQEGLEMIRNSRDNNWARERDSFNNFPSDDNHGYECRVDHYEEIPLSSLSCGAIYSKKLYLDAGGFYSHDSTGNAETRFQRRIVIGYNTSNRDAADEMKVVSVVSWGGSFPPVANPVSESNCSALTKCVFSEAVLDKWGE